MTSPAFSALQMIPAIDLLDGKVVRLSQGRRDRVTVYSDDPVAIARSFAEAGARRLHVVDLNGAFDGQMINLPLIQRVADSVPMEVEVGGGIRSLDSIQALFDAGVRYAILGTRAFEDRPFLKETLARHGDRIIVGVDAKDGRVAVRGWVDDSPVTAPEFVRELQQLGVATVVFTDIATDGMLTGPNIPSLREVAAAAPRIGFIASGGIANIGDIQALATCDFKKSLVGIIAGRALYSNTLNLRDAVELLKRH